MTISGSRFRKCVTVTSRPVEEIDQACDLFMGGLLFLRVLQTVVRQDVAGVVPVLTWPWDNIMIRFCCNCRYQMVVSVITWSIWRGRTCLSVCWQQTVEKPHNKRMVVVQQFYSYPSKHVWWCWEHDRVSAACRHRCCVKEASLHIISQQWVVACEAHSCSCWL